MSNNIRHFNKSASSKRAKPDDILLALDIKSGMNVLEIGVGGGYYVSKFAGMVGPSGIVCGVDTEKEFIDHLSQLNEESRYRNIRPILISGVEDILNVGIRFDVLFTRNAYHHLKNRAEYFRALSRALKPDCIIAIIDYNESLFSLTRILGHYTKKETIVDEQRAAGNELVREVSIFTKQSFLLFRKQ
ncbi:MAG TPA: methyltransferase domain-containing protein [Bacteroidota bacterium]|nr:methyltransferase domain-containing protein [Bacteroidota bacterium]